MIEFYRTRLISIGSFRPQSGIRRKKRLPTVAHYRVQNLKFQLSNFHLQTQP